MKHKNNQNGNDRQSSKPSESNNGRPVSDATPIHRGGKADVVIPKIDLSHTQSEDK